MRRSAPNSDNEYKAPPQPAPKAETIITQPVTTKETTTTTIETTESTTSTTQTEMASSYSMEKILINSCMKGTYYTAGGCGHSVPCYGGSGRYLIDCSYGNAEVKGSVACRYVWANYGYNYNGKRTMVYLEINERPDMNGYYYVDDCCGSYSVIDFYYDYQSNCPFQWQGVLTVDNCYIIEY